MRDKGLSAAGTLAFMALVTTNAQPQLWQIAFVSIGMYEAMLLAVKTGRKVARDQRRKKNKKYRQQDAHRWAEQWFNPYKEVKG